MTLIVKLLVLVVAALYARVGTVALRRPVSDFYVAGRLVPAMFNGAAIAIGLVPVLAFAVLAGALSQDWDGLSLLALSGGAGLVTIAFLFAPYLRKFGGYSVPDFLGERFDRPEIRLLAVIAVIVCTFPALALSLLGLGELATRIFAVDLLTGVGLAVAMLLSCSFAAGMRSASLTQIVQYAVLLAASLVALGLLLGQQGTAFPALDAARLASIRLETFAAEDSLNRFALLFCVTAGIASLPHLLLRGLVTPSIEEARTSFLWALPFTAALCLVAAPYLALFGEAPAATADMTAILGFRIHCNGRDRGVAGARERARSRRRQRAVIRPLLQGLASHRFDRASHSRCSGYDRGRRRACRLGGAGRARNDPRHDRSRLLTGGEHALARSPSRCLVETCERRRRSCRHAGGTCRVSLLHGGVTLLSVRLLRDLELPLERHGGRSRALQRLEAELLSCR